MRRALTLFAGFVLLAALGCAQRGDASSAVDVAPTSVAVDATTPATPPADAPGSVDFSCTTDADCAIKDVGNCCGAYPACVNRNSPTFPEQVKAQCAAQGLSSVCGYPSITGCQCVEGKCDGVSGMTVTPAVRID